MSVALDRVRSQAADITANRQERYAKVVAQLAGGRDVPAEEVLATISDVGRSMEDLEADVETLQRRLDARAKLAARDAAEKQLAAAEKQLSTLHEMHEARLNKVKADHDAAVRKLIAEFEKAAAPAMKAKAEAERAIEAAVVAMFALRDTAPENLRVELAEAKAALARDARTLEIREKELAHRQTHFEAQKAQIRQAAEAEAESKVRRTLHQHPRSSRDPWAANHRAQEEARELAEALAKERIAAEDAKLDTLRAAVKQLQAAVAEHTAAIEAIERTMLVV